MSATNSQVQLIEKNADYRGHDFYPSHDIWLSIPALYGTEHVGAEDKVVHLHYFAADCDWWVVEVDHNSGDAFGYVCLFGDRQSAEWGYFDLAELEGIYREGSIYRDEQTAALCLNPRLVVERDLSWLPWAFFELGM